MSAFQYKFRVVDYRVVDGDTVDCTFDMGLDVYVKERVRLFGIDAAETRTKNLEEKQTLSKKLILTIVFTSV